jgi:hypothetical protein
VKIHDTLSQYSFTPRSKFFQPILNSNPDFSQVEIHVALGIPFDDKKLLTILVDEFGLTFDEIQLRNGESLSECCGHHMIGESSKH